MSLKVDPRIKRTRQLLVNALAQLLHEKEFSAITVQDITARAEVNRATFYAHFEDKYALLNYNVREDFLHVLEQRSSDWEVFSPGKLRNLVTAVYEFLSQFTGQCQSHGPAQHDDKLFVMAEVQKQAAAILLGWLQPSPDPRAPSRESAALIASWSIFGTSFHWTRHDRSLPPSEAADRILALITPGLMPYLAQIEVPMRR
jgi:AcrR family transcriptional regulator